MQLLSSLSQEPCSATELTEVATTHDFIGRMICLSWPAGIKVVVLSWLSLLLSIVLNSDSDIVVSLVFRLF